MQCNYNITLCRVRLTFLPPTLSQQPNATDHGPFLSLKTIKPPQVYM
jgi:hypothetical protein